MAYIICPVTSVQASCDQAAFSGAVSEANAVLTGMNERNKKALHEKLQTLKARSGWGDADYVAKAATLVKDERTIEMDGRNKTLLDEVSKLGAGETPGDEVRCAILERLKRLLSEVVQNTDKKWRHMHQKADASLNSATPGFATANTAK
ncbi:MAG: hypothetical protein H7X92_03435 [Chitinophagales bacterium]|nr:hypothetical protein [Hyphomicrobiales bacterium]